MVLFLVDTEEFNWRLACVCIEDQFNSWHGKTMRMRSLIRKDAHYASVDAVHLVNVSTRKIKLIDSYLLVSEQV